MGKIRQLEPAIINQIAAGEVVERPSSVLKELLENAIDAGASRVEVAVERGGKDLVRVADDGCGMEPEDLALAFRPHATSKLEGVDDLAHISTLGFRGEALAAIAEISKVRCQSRTASAEQGSELLIEGGQASPIQPCAGPPGTVIEVRNLFYNTPVRRTFLKSDSTEGNHVVEMFQRVALAHPTVRLSFRSGGKTVYDLPAVTGLKERIAVFFGRELAESLLWVESQVGDTHLWGYVAHPAQSRSSNRSQYLFVTGRYVRDRSLGHALSEAYRGLLMVGRMPVAFLFLEIPPDEVDVNVHPTKIEVRFRDSQRVYSQLLSTVRQVFLKSDLHTQLQAPGWKSQGGEPSAGQPATTAEPPARAYALVETAADRQAVASWFTPKEPSAEVASAYSGGGAGGGFQSFPEPGYGRSASAGGGLSGYRPATPAQPAWAQAMPPMSSPAQGFDEFAPASASAPELPPETEAPLLAGLNDAAPASPAPNGHTEAAALASPVPARPFRALQVHDSYLVAETDEGMEVIDQHALHERILYEELRERVQQGGVEAQQLLVPEPVDLTAADAAEVLDRRELLASLGLGVEPFGGDTVLVTRMPSMLARATPAGLLRDLADHFRTKPLPPTADLVLEDVLNMVACKAAVKAGQKLSHAEVCALLERRHLVANTHHCPHGRPTALVFTKAELERQFGRV